ncbi:MAG: heat-inducible transcription repressor HrcA [Ruminococcaceae bacterium]|nr:heat-inducible transcription repressor HrcA [Oscillospiraceae bacterium]
MLDERKKTILRSVISTYIETGEPVGSKALLDLPELHVSSATIRSEMLELEKLGLLCKPHTSAGRIPSEDGLRYYVQSLENTYKLDERDLSILVPAFSSCVSLIEMIKSASHCLADFTGYTVFSAAPTHSDGHFTFEVMRAGKNTLAIMAVSSNGAVKSVFTRIETDVSAEDINRLTNILNGVFAGFPVNEIGSIRVMLFKTELEKGCPKLNCVIAPVVNLVNKVKSYELFISGSTNLLSCPEFSNIEAARQYMDFLGDHESILEELLSAQGDLSVKIGHENKLLGQMNTSIVSVNCNAKIPIVFGILGPSRMDYSKIIAGCKHVVLQLKEQIDDEF